MTNHEPLHNQPNRHPPHCRYGNRWGAGWGGWGYGPYRSGNKGLSGFNNLPNRLPGQRPIPTTRPAPLPNVVR